MNPALWAAKTGLDAQQTRMTVTAHNLANVATSGFKKGRAIFEDLLYQNVKQVGGSTSQDTQSPSGLSLGTGVRIVATEKSYTQGSLLQTQNSLDLAVEGRGFFAIQLPDGTTGYTRDGSFQTNAQGELVTSSGYRVQPGITIPNNAQSITIGNDGVVSVRTAGQSAPVQVGTVQLTDFVNPAGLESRGENLVMESASSGPAQTGTPGLNGLGSLSQGSLESSNVNVVEELVNMIETQRAYEMNSKAISTTDQMLQYVTNNI
jgi:flagellar basal-body rod protein FlgG